MFQRNFRKCPRALEHAGRFEIDKQTVERNRRRGAAGFRQREVAHVHREFERVDRDRAHRSGGIEMRLQQLRQFALDPPWRDHKAARRVHRHGAQCQQQRQRQ